MHETKFEYREITPDELPTVKGEPATDQQLLDMGYVRIGGDFFASCHQERHQPDGSWKPHDGQERHGRLISQGDVTERHRRLREPERSQILHARVFRSPDPAENLSARVAAVLDRAKVAAPDREQAGLEHLRHRASRGTVTQHFVPMASVRPGDVTEDDELPPHRWHGE